MTMGNNVGHGRMPIRIPIGRIKQIFNLRFGVMLAGARRRFRLTIISGQNGLHFIHGGKSPIRLRLGKTWLNGAYE
jgi:hypothetical protein